MKLVTSYASLLVVLFSVLFYSCKDSKKESQTILQGTTTIVVDETVRPIIEDQIDVFEGEYNSSIDLVAKSETEISRDMLSDSAQLVVLSRPLNNYEIDHFKKRKIKPKITQFATDAIALIRNKANNDTLISLIDVFNFMKGKSISTIKGIVFDNPNSSTMRLFLQKSQLSKIPDNNVFYFKQNEDVIKYVSENDGVIGVVGLNWLYRPSAKVEAYLNNINVLNVKGINQKDFFAPTQNNLAETTYPLARDLFIINCQGTTGLGMGFSSFVAGEIGQRIILKSGLLPFNVPGRKLLIKN